MARRVFLAAMLVAAGCGEQGPAQLEVEMLSVSGQLGGASVPSTAGAIVSGERSGDQGTFFVEGPSLTLQLSACPLGSLDVDPYGGGAGAGPSPLPVPIEDPGVDGDRSGVVAGVDCIGRGLTLCAGHDCGEFTADEVELQIVEENGWRRVTADATGATGAVQIELRYREHR